MSAVSSQLRAAVVARLNQGVSDNLFSMEFVATDQILEKYTEEELATLRVLVVSSGVQFSNISRTMRRQDTSIAVLVMKRVGFASGVVNQAEFKALEQLTEEIADVLCDPLTGFEKSGPTEAPELDPPYDPELAVVGIFTAKIGVTYQTTRAVRIGA